MTTVWQNDPAQLREAVGVDDDDSYTVTVVFRRSFGDDSAIIEDDGKAFNADTAKDQFVRELQEAFDVSFMAGQFAVAEVRLKPHQVAE